MTVQTVNTTERLAALRKLMTQHSVQAYVVPSEDQHFSEYIAACDERRAFITGFTGSAGLAIVTMKNAYLFTDGRYFLQAEQQIDKNWTLMKQGLPDVPTWTDFLIKNLEGSTKIGIDANLITASDADSLDTSLTPKSSSLVSLSTNLADSVWSSDRPSRTSNPVFHLPTTYSGASFVSKLTSLRTELEKQKANGMVVTMLDEVAWLLNLRGSDIMYNPVFFAYAIVKPVPLAEGEGEVVLFTDERRIESNAKEELKKDNVEIRPYDEFLGYLKELGSKLKDEKIMVGDKASLAVTEALSSASSASTESKDKKNYNLTKSPIADLKSIKNDTELEGFRHCHIRDGVALARYFAWLEELLGQGKEIKEYQAGEQLEKFRADLELYKGLSFDTISSTGPNGAIIHYSPDPDESSVIKKDQIYLCDSGAQFLDGTTDVTRTLHFGSPSEEEKRAFTRVLQGHIEIDNAVFPNGTTGYIIDTWARKYLWMDGLDYRHGTGHGVGHFLNVHEGPQGIGQRIASNASPLKAGMTVSNEPGFYADNRFGIRIENVVLCTAAETPNNFGDKGWLKFERVTMCPIQTKLVKKELLDEKQSRWLNGYNKEVYEKVDPLLKKVGDERARIWLKRECEAI